MNQPDEYAYSELEMATSTSAAHCAGSSYTPHTRDTLLTGVYAAVVVLLRFISAAFRLFANGWLLSSVYSAAALEAFTPAVLLRADVALPTDSATLKVITVSPLPSSCLLREPRPDATKLTLTAAAGSPVATVSAATKADCAAGEDIVSGLTPTSLMAAVSLGGSSGANGVSDGDDDGVAGPAPLPVVSVTTPLATAEVAAVRPAVCRAAISRGASASTAVSMAVSCTAAPPVVCTLKPTSTDGPASKRRRPDEAGVSVTDVMATTEALTPSWVLMAFIKDERCMVPKVEDV